MPFWSLKNAVKTKIHAIKDSVYKNKQNFKKEQCNEGEEAVKESGFAQREGADVTSVRGERIWQVGSRATESLAPHGAKRGGVPSKVDGGGYWAIKDDTQTLNLRGGWDWGTINCEWKIVNFGLYRFGTKKEFHFISIKFKNFVVNQDLISAKRLLRVEGGREELGLQELSIWVSSKTIWTN